MIDFFTGRSDVCAGGSSSSGDGTRCTMLGWPYLLESGLEAGGGVTVTGTSNPRTRGSSPGLALLNISDTC